MSDIEQGQGIGPQSEDREGFLNFCLKMIRVGCIGFGGGSALIPVLESEFLPAGTSQEEHKALEQDVVAASLTPGALPVEIASGIGHRRYGRAGMVAGGVMMALPGAIMTLLFMILLSQAQESVTRIVKILAVGVSTFIFCMLIEYMEKTLKICRKESMNRYRKGILTILGVGMVVSGKNIWKLLGIEGTPIFSVSTITVLLAAFFFILYTRGRYDGARMGVAAVLCTVYFLGEGQAELLADRPVLMITKAIMLVLAIRGVIISVREYGKETTLELDHKGLIRDLILWGVFLGVLCVPAVICVRYALDVIFRSCISAWMSFGGGDAYLTIAEGLFVHSDLLTTEEYYGSIVPIVNVLPGSILCKTLTGIGYTLGSVTTGTMLGGILMAIACFACSVAMSCCSFGMLSYGYDMLSELRAFLILSRWVRPIISGLLINVILSLLRQDLLLTQYVSVSSLIVLVFAASLTAANILLRKHCRLNTLVILAIDLAAAIAFFH